MVIRIRQLLLRFGIVLAMLLLFAGLFVLLKKPQQPQKELLPDSAEGREAWLNLRGWQVGAPEISEAVYSRHYGTYRSRINAEHLY